MAKRSNTKEFIEKAKAVHGNRYDYSLVEYVNSTTKVKIICGEHGEFWQTPKEHSNKQGCPKCAHKLKGASQRFTTEQFIEKSKAIHKDKYDYSLVVYANNTNSVQLVCREHGIFKQLASVHLSGGGCPKCICLNKTNVDFIAQANIIHNRKYSYTNSNYINAKVNVCITCEEHGDFYQTPDSHLSGKGCPKCSGKNKDSCEFIIEANKIHNFKYAYDSLHYRTAKTKVVITCKYHGDFTQTPNNHLNGQGCPKCSQTGFSILKNAIFYVYQTEKFIGFGISNNFKIRNMQHKTTFRKNSITYLLIKQYRLSGTQALDIENKVKTNFKNSILDTKLDGFRREAVVPEQLDNLLSFIETYIKENPQTV